MREIYRAALPFVFLICALLIFPSPLTLFGLVGVVLFLVVRWLARQNPFPKTDVNPFLLVFLLMFVLGLLRTPAPELAWQVASHSLAGILVLISIVDRANSRAQILAATGVLVLVGVVFAFGAPFGAEWSGAQGFNFGELTTRYFPLLARPSNVNNVAGALEVAVPFALALMATHVRPWRLIGTFALAPLLVMLLLLQSRGAWLAVLMGLVVYLTLYRRWVLPLVPIVLLAGLWLNNAFGDPLPTQAIGADARQVVTFGDRTEIWSEGARLFLQSPLLGIGVHGFAAYGAPIVGFDTGEYALRGSHAHNLFLQITLDTGIIGGVAFVGIFLLAFVAAGRAYQRAEKNSVERALAIGLLAAFTIVITHGMFDTIFWGFKAGIFLWGTFALALRLQKANE